MNLISTNLSQTIYISSDLITNEDIIIETGATIIFCGGRIINNTDGVINIQGDNITLIAGPIQIFIGAFKFVSSYTYCAEKDLDGQCIRNEHYPAVWTMERAYPQWFGAKDCFADVKQAISKLGSNNATTRAAGRTILNDIPDSSAAINAAIRLKGRGEVFIPRGYYKISRHISVPPNIQLRGEGTTDLRPSDYSTLLFPWNNNPNPEEDATKPYCYANDFSEKATGESSLQRPLPDFPLLPADLNRVNSDYPASQKYGFLLTACIDDSFLLKYSKVSEEIDATTGDTIIYYSEFPESISYNTAKGGGSVGSEISAIALFDIMSIVNKEYATNEYATMRGILAGGAVRLCDVRVYGLSQLLSSSLFGDQTVLDHCSFTDPVMLRSDEKAEDREALYPTKIYGFEITNGGDAFVMHDCHVSSYNDRIGALKLRSCNGGNITGNILNSDVLIELCRGIDFAGNHMEYGANFTAATSAVSVRDNYIWRGTRPAITLRRFLGDAYNLSHWSVELSNNQLFWRSRHTAGEPQAAQSVYPYDIRTDGYGTLDIHNTFHTSSRLGPAEGSYFGLIMEWMEMHRYEIIDNHSTSKNFTEEDATLSPFEAFNSISHIASASSHIEGHNVTPMPATIIPADFSEGRDCHTSDPLVFRVNRHAVDEIDAWKRPNGVPEGCSYMYQAWLFADFKRKLFIPNNHPFAGQGHPESILLSPSSFQNGSKATMPDIDEHQGEYYNLRLQLGRGEPSNYDIPAGPYWMYIERSIWSPTTVHSRQSVKVPVISSCIFWDDGEYLSGYKWEEVSDNISRADEMESVNNLRPLRVTYHGRNVECLLASVPPMNAHHQLVINGEWLDGDVIEWTSFNDGTLIHYYCHNGMWYRK